MFNNSQDILYLVISFCIIWLTVFLCWTLYYLMSILRNANQVISEFRMRIQALTDAVNYVRSKVEHISGTMSLLTDGVAGFAKKMAQKKVGEWLNNKEEDFNDAAKEAVGKAVSATAKKIHKTAKKMRG